MHLVYWLIEFTPHDKQMPGLTTGAHDAPCSCVFVFVVGGGWGVCVPWSCDGHAMLSWHTGPQGNGFNNSLAVKRTWCLSTPKRDPYETSTWIYRVSHALSSSKGLVIPNLPPLGSPSISKYPGHRCTWNDGPPEPEVLWHSVGPQGSSPSAHLPLADTQVSDAPRW